MFSRRTVKANFALNDQYNKDVLSKFTIHDKLLINGVMINGISSFFI